MGHVQAGVPPRAPWIGAANAEVWGAVHVRIGHLGQIALSSRTFHPIGSQVPHAVAEVP